jgi:hypothetical protein
VHTPSAPEWRVSPTLPVRARCVELEDQGSEHPPARFTRAHIHHTRGHVQSTPPSSRLNSAGSLMALQLRSAAHLRSMLPAALQRRLLRDRASSSTRPRQAELHLLLPNVLG